MRAARWIMGVAAAAALVACGNSNNNAGGTTAGSGSTGGTGSSGTTGSGGPSCQSIVGTWQVTDLTCDGVDKGWPTQQTWTSVILADGGGAFHQVRGSCEIDSSGPWNCTAMPDGGFALEVVRSDPEQCLGPSSCNFTFPDGGADGGSGGCGEPAPPLYWVVTGISASTFTMTSTDSPAGEAIPLTTCTGLGAQNPITITWTRQ